MGCFTSVIMPDGNEIQFKTGYDSDYSWDKWEYKLGEAVTPIIDKRIRTTAAGITGTNTPSSTSSTGSSRRQMIFGLTKCGRPGPRSSRPSGWRIGLK
jgi:hypothetical protein